MAIGNAGNRGPREMTSSGQALAAAGPAPPPHSGPDRRAEMRSTGRGRQGFLTPFLVVRVCSLVGIDDGRSGSGSSGKQFRQRASGGQAAVRDQEVERRRTLGLGHRCGQLCHLPQSHHGPLHRVPGQPRFSDERGVHSGVGRVQPRLPLPLHLPVAQDTERLPTLQRRVGVPEVWALAHRRGASCLSVCPDWLAESDCTARDDNPMD
mmetsp:Transcript_16529/g.39679  ORF Transcript_16529/g.39679 Transcript_16529/m.39679 type:complete len:208 (+) Transcript_16529:281-904(+)